MSQISFIFKAIAKNPPSIFIIAGVFLAFIGTVGGYPDLVTVGLWCFVGGFILQVFWLITQTQKPRR